MPKLSHTEKQIESLKKAKKNLQILQAINSVLSGQGEYALTWTGIEGEGEERKKVKKAVPLAEGDTSVIIAMLERQKKKIIKEVRRGANRGEYVLFDDEKALLGDG